MRHDVYHVLPKNGMRTGYESGLGPGNGNGTGTRNPKGIGHDYDSLLSCLCDVDHRGYGMRLRGTKDSSSD